MSLKVVAKKTRGVKNSGAQEAIAAATTLLSLTSKGGNRALVKDKAKEKAKGKCKEEQKGEKSEKVRETNEKGKEKSLKERERKGKDLAIVSVVVPFETHLVVHKELELLDEAALATNLAGEFSELAPSIGYVWREGFPPQYPNHLGVSIPHASRIRGASSRPNDAGVYSLEVFRALQPSYLTELVKTNP